MPLTDPSRLPQTTARTVPSITIRASLPDGTFKTIGAIKTFTRTISRNTTRRFELDQDIPGRTVEIIPGAVNNIAITIRRAMLYRASLLEEFGYGGVEDLVSQNVPIEVVEIRHPKHTGDAPQQVTYHGCYFTSNPMSVDIDGDWQIIQEAELQVGYITVEGGPTES